MSEHDFLAYTTTFSLGKTSSSASNNTYPFIIEKKNGTISNQSLQLNAAPYDILKHMAAAIDYSSPPPPSEQLSSEKLSNTNNNQNDIDTVSLKNYFYSKEFHNELLRYYHFRKANYMKRLSQTKSQMVKVDKHLDNFL